ncbi:MAG: contractile injection system protein, VgrG/Pvc8 family [Oculatellaceae cyanobacterium bins.114]|nr:contractile injection system protein, VgrG/Pvc8 family [Oculatellaceae cyanobacterium bins.114]
MAKVPIFKLKYQGKDITQNIKPLTTSIAYTDKLEGSSDEIEVSLDNADLRWMDSWLPKEGDLITLQMGYEGEVLFPEVNGEIDEPEYQGPPDTLRLQAQATPITASLRQRRTQAYEKTTLRAIAQQIAGRHGLELVGNVPDLRLERVTQKEQTDLEFLLEQSQEYGLVFKIEGAKRLVFYKIEDLEKAPAVLTLDRTDLRSYRLTRKTKGTYKAAKIKYYNPATGKYIEVTIDANGSVLPKPKEGDQEQAVGDILNIRERVENLDQAKERAKEALRRENSNRIELDIDLEGNVVLAAGINFNLTSFKKFDGKFMIEQVKHSLTKRQGYQCSVKGRRVEQ